MSDLASLGNHPSGDSCALNSNDMNRLQIIFADVRPYVKDSWDLGRPMILIMFFQFAIGLTDVYVAGYLGTDVLAAVGYVGQLYWTLIILGNGITVGTVSMVSQAHSAKYPEGVGSIATHSLAMGLAISGVLAVVAGLFPEKLVRIAGMPKDIEAIAQGFMQIFAFALIPTYISIITGGVLRSTGRVRLAMFNGLIAAVVNVLGDFVLAFGWGPFPEMGFRGIACSSAIATSVGMSLNLAHLLRGQDRVRLRFVRGLMSRCYGNLAKLGVPSALQQVAWNTGTLVVYFLVGGLQQGKITALAAMTGGVRIEAIIFLPIFALSMAAAVLTGNRIGVGDATGARSAAKATAGLCMAVVSVPVLAMFILAPWVSGIITDDPAVRTEMTRYLRINMLGMPFMALGVTLSGALQGAGDTLATMIIVFIGMWVVRIPAILVAIHVLKLGAVGVWSCMTITMIALCVLMTARFRSGAWTRASQDKDENSMMWEACLGKASKGS